MDDFIEEYKAQQRRKSRSAALATAIVIVAFVGLLAFSIYNDKRMQRNLYAYGGAVGVENKTDHSVTLHLFVHDSTGSTVISHTIEPKGHWVLQDSMSKQAVVAFPPTQWLDSGYLFFDDTLLLRHAEPNVWTISYDDHCIHDKAQWRYESLTVRPASRYHPALYRPLRVYYITDEDYERAASFVISLSRQTAASPSLLTVSRAPTPTLLSNS